jgi:cyclophilin family peptidyl-prolyl cis-trans isomerase
MRHGSTPTQQLPRNADVALRRAIPIVNAPTGRVQERLEQILFLLRIPQRKPWGDMASALASSQAALVSDRDSILGAVPAAEREAAAATLASLAVKLERLQAAVAQQDADVTALRASQALADLAALEIAQAPGLPYLLPTQYASRPRLVGRAVVELTVARGGGSRFEPLSDGAGPQPTGRLVVTLDGYNAPLSSANFAALVAKGFFDGVPLSGSQADETLFALPAAAPPPPFSPTLPLELRSTSEFEPRYRAPLDVIDSGELPVLPLSVYGALAWARGTEGNDSSASQFFFFRFARQTAGLGGAAFDEGQYAVFGYVTEGNEILKQLRTGDVIKNARLVSGAERLVTPPATP